MKKILLILLIIVSFTNCSDGGQGKKFVVREFKSGNQEMSSYKLESITMPGYYIRFIDSANIYRINDTLELSPVVNQHIK